MKIFNLIIFCLATQVATAQLPANKRVPTAVSKETKVDKLRKLDAESEVLLDNPKSQVPVDPAPVQIPVHERVILYDGADFGGASKIVTIGKTLLANPQQLNEMTTSIKIPKDLRVILHEHGDVSGGYGRSRTFSADCGNLASCHFDNLISHVTVERIQNNTNVKQANKVATPAVPKSSLREIDPITRRGQQYIWVEQPINIVKNGKTVKSLEGRWQKAAVNNAQGNSANRMMVTEEQAFKTQKDLHQVFQTRPTFNDPFAFTCEGDCIKTRFKEEDALLPPPTQTTGKNIVFFKNLYLKDKMKLAGQSMTILVADTVYIGSNAALELESGGISHLKIVANHIYYEQALQLNLNNGRDNIDGAFVFSTQNILYKQGSNNVCCIPYLFDRKTTANRSFGQINWFKGWDEMDQVLQNERIALLMERTYMELSQATDVWKRDALIKAFLDYKSQFNSEDDNPQRVVNKYISVYNNFKVWINSTNSGAKIEVREMTLPSGKKVSLLMERSIEGVRYSLLPTRAKLLEFERASKRLFGTIYYKPTGTDKMKLQMDFELVYDEVLYEEARIYLKNSYKLNLNKEISNSLTIEEQAFKLSGATKGKILPLSARHVRVMVDLTEESKTLAEVIPKVNLARSFSLVVKESNKVFNMVMDYPSNLLNELQYSKLENSFDIQQLDTYTGAVSLENVIYSSANTTLGVVDYVEVKVEVLFGNEVVDLGTYRLSSFNTLASKTLIHFFKKQPNYKFRISGQVYYDQLQNMETIEAFETTDNIIIIDESKLSTAPNS